VGKIPHWELRRDNAELIGEFSAPDLPEKHPIDLRKTNRHTSWQKTRDLVCH